MCTAHRRERELKQYIIEFFFYHFGVWAEVPKLRKMSISSVDILKRVIRRILLARLTGK